MFPQPQERPSRGYRVEVGRTRHHIAEWDEDAAQAGPKREKVHLYYHGCPLHVVFWRLFVLRDD